MRPLQLLVSLSTSVVLVTLLLYLALGSPQEAATENSGGGVKALFSFTSPGSLFPPSAIISLTDDNSTFFLARPAAFGPDLPKDGFSGPLWIGSGFGDDSMSAGGELGCSDSEGWGADNDGFVDAGASTSAPRHDAHHADIQSIQESAEIAGKVVLLKRGGCGFLAKVQWAQRRGGTAVIVGDDVRGGALVRMYAKGDTSNITIPSLFTSHTTAHLLSSLIPSKTLGRVENAISRTEDGVKHANQKEPSTSGSFRGRRTPSKEQTDYDDYVTTAHVVPSHKVSPVVAAAEEEKEEPTSMLNFLLSKLGLHGATNRVPKAGSRRLPGSGDLDWLEKDEWIDDQKPIQTRPASPGPLPERTPDTFVIGKHDWRDPDMLSSSMSMKATNSPAYARPSGSNAGAGVLPGSGEYPHFDTIDAEHDSWWQAWFGVDNGVASSPKTRAKTRSVTSITGADSHEIETSPHVQSAHEGLWVTLTPTNVSTSPFFDTLLVLVVSPLVTLTVVYALLLLRSRIRRRRWRAPKSVVERLPIRTYQTLSDISSSATSSATSPTTPLLQHSPSQSVSSISPPRSGVEPTSPNTSSAVPQHNRDREEEKRESGLAAWRRRYGGRQKECVVCLEEYVDGVSQVMSLPCGHEFHADCITPWLVTRRRTCPICKGDVVRSLSQSYHDRLQSPSPTRPRRSLGDADDIQTQAAETRNDSPSASQPVPISRSAPADYSPLDDVENGWRGLGSRRSSEDMRPVSGAGNSSSLRDLSTTVSTVIWRGFDVVRNTTGFQRRTPQPEDVDRNR